MKARQGIHTSLVGRRVRCVPAFPKSAIMDAAEYERLGREGAIPAMPATCGGKLATIVSVYMNADRERPCYSIEVETEPPTLLEGVSSDWFRLV